MAPSERRQSERPSAATSGRCGFCGSRDTFGVSPQGFQEWALERWGDAALLRCHDCGRRQAVAGLSGGTGDEWRPARGLIKVMAWAFAAAAAVALLVFFLRKVEEGAAMQQPLRLPRQQPPSPRAPAPSPPTGPFSLRSTPTSAA